MTKHIRKEGDWELLQYVSDCSPEQYYYLGHECRLMPETGRLCRWYYREFWIPCGFCSSPIPEGLQGLYVMLSGDMEPRHTVMIDE